MGQQQDNAVEIASRQMLDIDSAFSSSTLSSQAERQVRARANRALESKPYSVLRIDRAWRRNLRMRQEGERGADEADNAGADEACFGGCAGVGAARRDQADDDAAGNHAGDPSGVIVTLGTSGLRCRLKWRVHSDAQHAGVIDAEACARWVAGRVAIKIGVGYAGEEAMDGRAIGVVNDDGLAVDEALQTVPCGIGHGHGPGIVGQCLAQSAGDESEGDEERRKLFHEQRC